MLAVALVIGLAVGFVLAGPLSYNNKISTLESRVAELEEAPADLQAARAELDKAKETISSLEAEISSLEAEIDELKTPEPEPEPEEKVVVLGLASDINFDLDPGWGFETWIMSLGYNVFDTLYKLKPGIYPDTEYEPCLAVGEPVVSEDKLEWTIELRDDVYFHDGTKFNAEAWKFSIDRVKELDSYPAWALEPIDSVEVLDEYKVKIILKEPYAALKGILLLNVASPVSPTAVESMSRDEFGEKPIGTGPFKYVEWVKGDHITIERNEDYWDKDRIPKIDRLVWKIFADPSTLTLALESGDIDAIWSDVPTSDIPTLLADPDVISTEYTHMYIHWITLNTGLEDSPLKDVRVRRAIALCVDQDEISSLIYDDVFPPIKASVFHPGMMTKPSWLPWTENVDIDEAKALLTEAGYPDGIDITISYTPVAYGKEETDLAILLQQQLAKADIRSELVSYEISEHSKLFRAGAFECTMGIMAPDWPDPDGVAMFIAHSKGSYTKRVQLNSAEIDELVERGRAETDYETRVQIYGELQDKLADQMCYVPMVKYVDHAFYSEHLLGVESYYMNFPPWWLLDIK
jgi:peptide/nickel transport system substrate-binding protein